MADNYLEKRMEEYRAGKLAPRRRTVVHTAADTSALLPLRFEPQRVMIPAGGDSPLGISLIKLLRRLGQKVAFTGSDSAAGTQLAQTTGSRFYPAAALTADAVTKIEENLVRTWGGADVLVCLPGVDAEGWNIEARRVSLPSDIDPAKAVAHPESAAMLLAVLTHPELVTIKK